MRWVKLELLGCAFYLLYVICRRWEHMSEPGAYPTLAYLPNTGLSSQRSHKAGRHCVTLTDDTHLVGGGYVRLADLAPLTHTKVGAS